MIVFKIADARGARGGKAILAYDGEGNQLPGQVKCDLAQEAGGPTMIAVTFFVDGKAVRLASE